MFWKNNKKISNPVENTQFYLYITITIMPYNTCEREYGQMPSESKALRDQQLTNSLRKENAIKEKIALSNHQYNKNLYEIFSQCKSWDVLDVVIDFYKLKQYLPSDIKELTSLSDKQLSEIDWDLFRKIVEYVSKDVLKAHPDAKNLMSKSVIKDIEQFAWEEYQKDILEEDHKRITVDTGE